MTRDAAATKARILDAAIGEFCAHGFAGARIDRIAQAADANKRSIYVYFGSKDGLFLAALNAVIGRTVAANPLTEDDLPGYAGRVFDYYLEHPETIRMTLWRRLERPEEGPDEGEVYAGKLEGMRRARSRHGTDIAAEDLIVLIFGMTVAWSLTTDAVLSADGSDPRSAERIAQHRAALVEAVRRVAG